MARARVTSDAIDFTSDGSTSNAKLTGSSATLALSSDAADEVDLSGVGALSCTEVVADTLELAAGLITDTSGSISFGDDDLETTGDLTVDALSCTEVAAGTLELAEGSITDTSGSISFGDEDLQTTGSIHATTMTATSDERLKTHIVPLGQEEAQSLIGLLEAVRFEWRDRDMQQAHGPQIGLLAQNVEMHVPEVVTTDAASGIKSIDYSKLVALLIAAIQPLLAAAYGQPPVV